MLLQAQLNGRNLGSTSHSARTWLTLSTSAACREPWLLSWPTYGGYWVSGQLSPLSADVTGTENTKRPQLPHRTGMGPSLRKENALTLLRGGKGREFLSQKYKNAFFLKKSFVLCKISNICKTDSNIPSSSHDPGLSSRVSIRRSLFHPGLSPLIHVPRSFISKSVTSHRFIRKYFNTSLKDKDSFFSKHDYITIITPKN